MQENTKRKLPLIIGIGLPLILVLWILLFVNILPAIFVRPAHDFIYVTGYEKEYVNVVGDSIVDAPCPYQDSQYSYRSCFVYLQNAKIYLYDVRNNESIPLSLEEAKRYKLDSSQKSPDGYFVTNNDYHSGDFYFFPFFWGGDSSRNNYIKKDGGLARVLNLQGYYYDFKFLGWVLTKNQ